MVRSPLTAARATFALKAGEWFRRGRLLMVSPVHGDYRRCQAEIPLIVLFRFPEPALFAIRPLNGADCLSCFHSSASASQYSVSEYSISVLASAARSRHMVSNAANCFLEYMGFPVVA